MYLITVVGLVISWNLDNDWVGYYATGSPRAECITRHSTGTIIIIYNDH